MGTVIAASVFVLVAALVHVLIFLMESVLWSRPGVFRRFGVADATEAATLRVAMFNQGFYNLFLALGAGTGLVLLGIVGWQRAGLAIAAFALLSMVLAALVLIATRRSLWRAALIQGGPALVGLVLLVAALGQPAGA
ncbi:MAG: DUF1304 domain-containing protein [Actinomycetales bacterium]|nr:DUF1304 domain-containing protein [Actinomycetales bacterium]